MMIDSDLITNCIMEIDQNSISEVVLNNTSNLFSFDNYSPPTNKNFNEIDLYKSKYPDIVNKSHGVAYKKNNPVQKKILRSPTVSANNQTINTLSTQENLLNYSRITPTGNGCNLNNKNKLHYTKPTNGQKWWAAIILGFIFALISSPAAYSITSKATTTFTKYNLMDGNGPNFIGLLIHTIIFIIIMRIILW